MLKIYFVLFFIGIIIGAVIGWIQYSHFVPVIIGMALGGFLSSGLAAVHFTYMYFFFEESDKHRINRLKKQIKKARKKS